MRILYLLLAPALLLALGLAGWMLARACTPRVILEGVFYLAFGLTGLPICLPVVRRAWRRDPIDDRLLQVWITAFMGGSSLLRFSRARETLNLLIGVFFLIWSAALLVAVLRRPEPPKPEPEPEPLPSLPRRATPDAPARNGSLDCAPWLAIGVVMAAVALFVARQLRLL